MSYARLLPAGLLLGTLALAGGMEIEGFNSPIRVADGEVREENLSALNGSIQVGDGAKVGECQSVNGAITIGEGSRVESLSSVNGRIEVGPDTVIAEGISAVNGKIFLDKGSSAREISTINGKIKLASAEIAGDINTINGDIALDASTVGGDIVIEDRGNDNGHRRPLKIELDGGSVVEGSILVEEADTEVEVYLRGGSRVMGRIENAKVIEG